MTSEIQQILVRSFERRTRPDEHIVYAIQIQGIARDWTVWRRYSEFETLVADLLSQVGTRPPAPLPPKKSWFRPFASSSTTDIAFLDARKAGLEAFLRALIASKDPRFRASDALNYFLAAPVSSKPTHLVPANEAIATDFTLASWLDEHADLAKLARSIRSSINAAHSATSRQHSIDAKKSLASLVARLTVLTKGLQDLRSLGITDGELRRRTDMVHRLQDDAKELGTAVNARPNAPAESSRHDLVSHQKPVVRALGAAALETAQTRPLDNSGLLQLQHQTIDDQDSRINALSAVVRRQKDLASAIGNELEVQNELLDDLDRGLDRTKSKMDNAGGLMKRLGK